MIFGCLVVALDSNMHAELAGIVTGGIQHTSGHTMNDHQNPPLLSCHQATVVACIDDGAVTIECGLLAVYAVYGVGFLSGKLLSTEQHNLQCDGVLMQKDSSSRGRWEQS